MTCERHHDALGAWVDGTLDRIEQRELEDHLAVCAACSALAADLRRIRGLAGELDRLDPPAALWHRIAARTAREAPPRRRPGTAWMALAAAAVLVFAVAVAMWSRPSSEPPGSIREAGSGRPVDLARTVEAELRLAEQHYENAIAGLEQLARDREMLDPNVAATLHRNLQLIDTAIAESRTALQAQPGSHPAQQSLFDAFRTKIALLEDTIYLLSELRRNSQASNAGAASPPSGEPSS